MTSMFFVGLALFLVALWGLRRKQGLEDATSWWLAVKETLAAKRV